MSVSKYAYIYARIRARKADMLDEKRLKALVDARDKDDFLSSLRDSPYKDKLTTATSNDSREIEKALKEELIDQYLMVMFSMGGEVRAFFEELLRRFEVKNIKTAVSASATGVAITEELPFPSVDDFFGRRIRGLSEADSVESVAKQLENPYRSILEEVFAEYKKSKKILILERALDDEIYGAIWNRMNRLEEEDKKIVRTIVGMEFDIANLMTLLRCKSDGIEEKELRSFFFPYYFTLDFAAPSAKASVSASDVRSAIQMLPPSVYKDVLTDALPEYVEENSLIPFENALKKLFLSTIKQVLIGYPFNIGAIIGFLYLKDIEIKNLCSIAVCKEKEIPPEEITRSIIVY